MKQQQKSNFWLSTLVFIMLTYAIAALAGWVTNANLGTWFNQLQQPSYSPPAFVFGPVWMVLYLLIGISGGVLWRRRQQYLGLFTIYIAQLVFNFGWSVLFFGVHSVLGALIDMLILLVLVAILIAQSRTRVRVVSYLLLPYLAWLCFATAINIGVLALN